MNNYFTIIFCYLICTIPLYGLEANLIQNSPFVPEGFNAKPIKKSIIKAPVTNKRKQVKRDLEFQGYYSLNGKFHFNLFNKKEKKGEWLNLGIANGPYEIIDFDEDRYSLSVKVDGAVEILTLRQPTDKPMAIKSASNAIPVVNQNNNRGRVEQTNRTDRNTNKRRRVVPRRPIVVPRRTNPKAKQQTSNNSNQSKNGNTNQQPEIFNQLGIGLGNSNDPNNPLNSGNIPIPRRPVPQRK